MAEKSKKTPKKMPKQMPRQQQQQRQEQGGGRAGAPENQNMDGRSSMERDSERRSGH
ncbi:hypothetical protein [Nocardia bovistercoris]|uniref:Uncharacterized protein n=1 Tax=Nocardia bovistercoris TaxID=2785916 RepID=A0A931MZ24_9NOCA|nr:hypothetical protein [Nocardia bovistercoris]MBH0775685.1 hypothetical protein [Nocardia bovistercoris]